MIRINLMAVERGRTTRKPGIDFGNTVGLASGVNFHASILVMQGRIDQHRFLGNINIEPTKLANHGRQFAGNGSVATDNINHW